MPTTRKRGTAVAAATLGLLLSGAFAGCSVSKDDHTDKPDSSSPRTPTPTPTQQPTRTPSATPSPTASQGGTAAPTATPDQALLGAAELPQLNPTSHWTEGKTTVPGPTSFGLCQQFDTLSIGAMNVVQRSFTTGPSGTDTAGQQIAEYPDVPNTVRATKVLESFHDKCRGQVKGTHVKIGTITDVPLTRGKGWWYLVSYTRGGTGHFHSFGVVVTGARMALLKMDQVGQDHNYPAGQDPMELAVKAASAKMG
jgi:hypothetical protein